jgi:RNA polymerase sigma factor (TIGR02999 family)
MSDVTLILDAISRGESQASDQLLPLVYDELRKMAAVRMLQESAGHTLQPTALVHEAWLRLSGGKSQSWENRAHFFGAAAEAMRRILVDHARRKARLKYGGGQQRVNIDDLEVAEATPDKKVLLVDEALEELERTNPERARVIVLKFFGGLTSKEIAEMMGIGKRSVDRHWECAKAWLFQKIQPGA